MLHTVESMAPSSKKSPRCATHRRDDLRGVQDTEEMISAVFNITQRQSPQCATHRRDDLSGVQHTAVTNCTPGSQNRNLHLSVVAFKVTIRRNTFGGERIYYERIILK